MIDLFLTVVNWVACVSTFIVATSFFFARGEPKDMSGMWIQIGLLLLMATSLSSPVAIYQANEQPGWWAVGFRSGVAMVALTIYDWRFGIRDQVTHLMNAPRDIWRKLRGESTDATPIGPIQDRRRVSR